MENRTGDDGEDVGNTIRKALQCVHVPFQHTSTCNLSTVNALKSCNMSYMIKGKCQFDNSGYWGIVMNYS